MFFTFTLRVISYFFAGNCTQNLTTVASAVPEIWLVPTKI